jgi:hypothetical protein
MELFFPASRQAIRQVTSLFEFVWPTAAALWNLRWQVQGFIAEVPHATVDQLKQRFLFGSRIDNVDLKRTVTDYTWDDQTAIFGSFVLTNAFAIYEQWADEILHSLGERAGSGKKLQFPDKLVTTIAALLASESGTLKSAYYPIYSADRKYSLPHLQNLMMCYRYFKEVRNAQVHAGGLADQKAVDAYTAFQPVSGKAQLGRKGELAFDPVTLGQKVSLNLRGVVGFTDVLIKIIATIDAELCRAEKAEAVFERALRTTGHRAMLSANQRKRHAQVSTRCTAAGFPPPKDPGAVYNFLLAHRLIVI